MNRKFVIVFYLLSISVFSQEQTYYQKAMSALESGDTSSAKDLLELSLRREKISEANYQLAKIFSKEKESTYFLNKARTILYDAIQSDPNIIKYRLLMADMHKRAFKINIFDRDALSKAEYEYFEILKIDNDFEKAHFELAKLFERGYYEYVNSEIANLDLQLKSEQGEIYHGDMAKTKWNEFVRDIYKSGSYATLKLDDKANELFNLAIEHFSNTIRVNEKNFDAYYKSAMLYNFAGKYSEAIKIIEKGEKYFPGIYELKLAKAYAYHKLSSFEAAQENFDIAFSLMNAEDRTEFKIQSVIEIINPSFKDNLKNKSVPDIERILDYFWKVKDPLNLTKQNERLLEHYCRMVYANYYLSPYDPYIHDPGEVEIKGWKSEQGNIYVRYGEPENKRRLRANIDQVLNTNFKTDIWNYGDFEFSFVDFTNRKNFKLGDSFAAGQFASQVGGDSKKLSDDLMIVLPNDYKPEFKGPQFDLPFNICQMRGKYTTDIYLNFSIDQKEISGENSVYKDGINYGVFLFDKYMNPIIEIRDSLSRFTNSNSVKTDRENSYLVKSLHSPFPPKEGNFAFEVVRKKDKGVSTNRIKLKVKKFPKNDVLLSDIVLASDVKIADASGTTIKRENYNILPNPVATFSNDTPLFLYFEIYNLRKDNSNLTNFEQRITIQEKEEEGLSDILNSLGDFIGIDSRGDKITLSSNYSTLESDPKIYLQLDMSDYDEGEYIIGVTVKDNITGKEISGVTNLVWKD
ncbi:MAG: GWxTD domain-containing protein [Ignavibacteria bacterium]|jgi:GWxTD domain-containing protein